MAYFFLALFWLLTMQESQLIYGGGQWGTLATYKDKVSGIQEFQLMGGVDDSFLSEQLHEAFLQRNKFGIFT